MRVKSFCLYFLLLSLCLFTMGPASIVFSGPTLKFTSWKPGQSPLVTGPYIPGQTTEEELSFLTNEETECKLLVNVGYAVKCYHIYWSRTD